MRKVSIDFFQVPPPALNALRKELTILQCEDGAIELHLGTAHVMTWTAETGWKTAAQAGTRAL